VFSAAGLLMAAVEHHGVRTIPRGPQRSDPAAFQTYADRLATDVEANLMAQGFAAETITTRAQADVRYLGQSSELTIPLTDGDPAGAMGRLRTAFDQEHRRTFGHWAAGEPIEVVSVRAVATVPVDIATLGAPPMEPTARDGRSAYFGDGHGWLTTPVVGRGQLGWTWQTGPLIVEEYDATTVVPPGARVRIGEQAMIEIEVETP